MSKSRKKPKPKKRPYQRLPREDYQRYINSAAWRAVRQRYFDSKFPQNCLVCDAVQVDLHHRTYKRLGFEWLSDLAPLCRKHHQECHAFIDFKKLPLTSGTNRYLTNKKARWHGSNGNNPNFRVKLKDRVR